MPSRMPAFAILAIVQATLIFTIALIMIPLPTIAAAFRLGDADLLMLQVAYGLPFSGLLLFGGRLADRYGARRLFTTGLSLFGTASLIAAFTSDFESLTAMRFLQGVAGALIAPAALALVRALFPEVTAFGRAMAIWGGVSVLGAILGFVSSGMVASFVSWRWMFAVPIAVSTLGLVAAATLLPSARPAPEAARPGLDPVGALLATAGLVSASYGLIASHEKAWTSAQVLAPLAAGSLLLAVFFLVERRVKAPLLPPGFLLDPARLAGLAGMLLAAAGSLLIEYVLLIYLQQVRGWSAFETAVSFLPFAAALIGINLIAVSIVVRIGAGLATAAGFLTGAAGLACLATLNNGTSFAGVLLPGQVLLAIGMALSFAGAAVLSTRNVPLDRMGLAGGVMNTAMELGPTLGFALLMAVAATRTDAVEGYALAFATASASCVIAAAIVYAVAGRRPLEGAKHD